MRFAPPPDFRYVGLAKGLPPSELAVAGAGAATSMLGMVLVTVSQDAVSLLVTAAGGALTALALGRRGALAAVRRIGAAPTPMAVVPWGVLVHPDGDHGDARALRWPGIASLTVDCVHTSDGGVPSTAWSFVTVETAASERFVGRAAGAVGLERLVANLEAWADECARPLALDLDSEQSGPTSGVDAGARTLLSRARDLVGSALGAVRLSLAPASYREGPGATASSDDHDATVEALRVVLRAPPGPADARALAALVAGVLGQAELVPDLLRLVTAPNPLVAACCKAAALRLGAEPNRAGALSEVAPFLFDDDLEVLESFASHGAQFR